MFSLHSRLAARINNSVSVFVVSGVNAHEFCKFREHFPWILDVRCLFRPFYQPHGKKRVQRSGHCGFSLKNMKNIDSRKMYSKVLYELLLKSYDQFLSVSET